MTETSTMGAPGIYDLGDVYDTIYQGRGKDYAHESAVVAALVRDRLPDAHSLLDVGCGTGAHLRHLAADFDDVAGLDVAEGMLAVARRDLPGTPLHRGDMRSFDLGRRFDAVVSLFSAIGNMRLERELDDTLAAMVRHLRPGGVVVVEPWWFPENFTPGHVGTSMVSVGTRSVARMSHTVAHDETASRMDVHYLVAEPAEGVWHFEDTHVMALFTRERYEEAFRAAGLRVAHLDPQGYGGNGLFVGVLDRSGGNR